MRLAKALCFLMILGSWAVAAHADPIDPNAAPDPSILLDDPSCPSGAFCANLTYNGPTMTFTLTDPLQFLVPNPPGAYPIPPVYTCSTSFFPFAGLPLVSVNPLEFLGCDFYGTVTNGEAFTISALGGPVELTVPNSNWVCTSEACPNGVISLTPEPGSAALCLIGLVCLVCFRQKTFGAVFRS
jgi:hypothetical protein